MMHNQFSVSVNLIVKADSQEQAEGTVADRLNSWFLETNNVVYPNGSLLSWNYYDRWDAGAVQNLISEGNN